MNKQVASPMQKKKSQTKVAQYAHYDAHQHHDINNYAHYADDTHV